ncbi:MAG: saccharopine dehydrogenase NADP-binding domain-containing protein [Deltaproteobacteria bacterium]|nr:saccharopine dehydrogenase NADP-binding domain-containing protein [Deltaproteobacteria bacterium]
MNPSVLILGAGEMGKAVAHDLSAFVPDVDLSVLDSDPGALQRLQEFSAPFKFRGVPGDIQDLKLIRELISGSDVVVGAVSYRSNFVLSRLAVECKASWIDLGGNHDIVDQQFTLDKDAKSAGVTIIPDCGLAPGMVNIIAGHAFRELDVTDEIHLRVGGLPQNPKPPLNYELCFSAEGLINEYIEPTRVLRDGRLVTQDSLCEWEHLDLGAPYDNLEAFYTSGGTSTLVKSFEGRVRNLDYKTIRYTGHLDRIKFLSDFGYFDSEEWSVGEKSKTSPREITEALFHRLGWVKRDVVLLKAWALGQKEGKPARIDYSLVDEYDAAAGLTAMARTTGFSAAIIAEMITDGRIQEKGVLYQELSVPYEEYFAELRKRGIDIRVNG